VERARLYSNENFPRRVVEALRALGHDVLTSFEAGRANQRVPDDEVLRFAAEQQRAVLTLNRRHFVKLHRATQGNHGGIVVCSSDERIDDFARRIDEAIRAVGELTGELVRVNRP
jgi:hypothetical protein